jgi:hypothetical protein
LLHERFIGMACCAQIRCTIAKCCCARALDIVNTMTIDTSRNVLVTLFCKSSTVYALLIGIVNGAMAFGTSLRNDKTCAEQQFPCIFIGQPALGMWVMTIGTDRCICISGGIRLLMDTIQCFLVLIVMTLSTGEIQLQ